VERHDNSKDTGDDMWEAERPYLLRVAQRVLGGRDGAEDVVQEALGRLVRADVDAITDVRGWLTVVVRNVAIDRVRSAHSRHESTGDDALGTASSGVDPADRVTLDDQVQRALAVVLDRLSPPERTAFVLHDIFGFSFAEVAQIVGRAPAACRQLASRARRSIRTDSPPLESSPAAAQSSSASIVTERFIAACEGGDLNELMAVLDPDVSGLAAVLERGPFVETVGRDTVSTRLLQLFGPSSERRMVPIRIEDREGVIVIDRGRVRSVIILELVDNRIHHIDSYVKLLRSSSPATPEP
jgi:RNA polymerase sigma-70 factor (ECF subfamily)